MMAACEQCWAEASRRFYAGEGMSVTALYNALVETDWCHDATPRRRTMDEIRARIADALEAMHYESSRGGQRKLMPHHIEAISDYLASCGFLALPPTEGEPVGFAKTLEWSDTEKRVGKFIHHEREGYAQIPLFATPQESAEVEKLKRGQATCLRALDSASAEVERLRSALEEIANHSAMSYDYHSPAQSDGDRQYQIGVTDGHRLAAKIARAALNTETDG